MTVKYAFTIKGVFERVAVNGLPCGEVGVANHQRVRFSSANHKTALTSGATKIDRFDAM